MRELDFGHFVAAVVGALLIGAGLIYYSNDEAVPAEPKPRITHVTVPPPRRAKLTAPEIGMRYSEFYELCGQQTRSTWSESALGRRTVYFYSSTPAREARNCVGYFVFDDFELSAHYSE